MDGEVERWDERRSPRGEMEGREYRLKRSALNHFTLSLSAWLWSDSTHFPLPVSVVFFLLSFSCTSRTCCSFIYRFEGYTYHPLSSVYVTKISVWIYMPEVGRPVGIWKFSFMNHSFMLLIDMFKISCQKKNMPMTWYFASFTHMHTYKMHTNVYLNVSTWSAFQKRKKRGKISWKWKMAVQQNRTFSFTNDRSWI